MNCGRLLSRGFTDSCRPSMPGWQALRLCIDPFWLWPKHEEQAKDNIPILQAVDWPDLERACLARALEALPCDPLDKTTHLPANRRKMPRSPPEDARRPGGVSPLSEDQRDFLVAAWTLSAFDSDSRRTTEEIVKKAKGEYAECQTQSRFG